VQLDNRQQIFVVDDDPAVCRYMCGLLETADFKVRSYSSAKQFLKDDEVRHGCLIVKFCMPDMTGLELQEEVIRRRMELAVIITTGQGNVSLAVRAMKAGAIDFLEIPFDDEAVLASVRRALLIGTRAHTRNTEAKIARDLFVLLTPREQDVLAYLIKGRTNKITAYELAISPRTVEIHRARIMEKMKASSLSDLVRLALAAGPELTLFSSVEPPWPEKLHS
jgi:two-component system, LuxR family, response regulator FixJ